MLNAKLPSLKDKLAAVDAEREALEKEAKKVTAKEITRKKTK